MEEFVRNMLISYPDLEAEKTLFAHEMQNSEDPQVHKNYQDVVRRIEIINSWLRLLTYDERFVVEKHLFDKIEWSRIALAFENEWKGQFFRTERTLVRYQANAIKKIVVFIEKHPWLVKELKNSRSV